MENDCTTGIFARYRTEELVRQAAQERLAAAARQNKGKAR